MRRCLGSMAESTIARIMLPALLSPVAQPWKLDATHTPPAYTRAVVGSELYCDRASHFKDGHCDVCIGVHFTSSLNKGDIQQRTRRALAKLRFHCPIIAATIDGPDDGVFTRRWVYVPMRDQSDCDAWLDATLAIQERGPSLDAREFIDNRVRTRLPVNSSGQRSEFQCHILIDDAGTYGLYFHGSHAILDAWPTFFAFGLMLEWIAADSLDVPTDLEFGSEYKNLPLDPVSASGGPRETWDTQGVELFTEAAHKRANTTPILTLLPPSRKVCTDGPRVRFERVFSPSETDKIVAICRHNGFSPTQLLDAAYCLALAESNPELVRSPEIDFFPKTTIVSLEREFTGHVDKRTHFISAYCLMPIRIPMRKLLDVESTRERLLLTASALKADYTRYLESPCLAHLLVAQTAIPQPVLMANLEGQGTQDIVDGMLTSLGKVSTRLPNEYVGPSGERVLHVHDMCVGHRITTTYLVLQSWTFENSLHVQLQASDMWAFDSDRAYLERFFDTMQRLILEQLD